MSNQLITQTLTDGERLWLWRKFRARVSRFEVTQRLGFGRDRISNMENDLYPVSVRRETGIASWKPPLQQPLTLQERLALARRRSGMHLRAAAKAYGVSHMTFLKMETAGSLALWAWWLSQADKKASRKKV